MPQLTNKFILDKPYYTECFEQSVPRLPFKQAYLKAMILTALGALLVLFTQVNQYAAWFVFSLGVLEAVAQYYRKPWWVMRQMLSRAAKSEVELSFNEDGIKTTSFYVNQQILWQNINTIEEKQLGWVIIHDAGRNYISKQHLTDEMNELLLQKEKQINH